MMKEQLVALIVIGILLVLEGGYIIYILEQISVTLWETRGDKKSENSEISYQLEDISRTLDDIRNEVSEIRMNQQE